MSMPMTNKKITPRHISNTTTLEHLFSKHLEPVIKKLSSLETKITNLEKVILEGGFDFQQGIDRHQREQHQVENLIQESPLFNQQEPQHQQKPQHQQEQQHLKVPLHQQEPPQQQHQQQHWYQQQQQVQPHPNYKQPQILEQQQQQNHQPTLHLQEVPSQNSSYFTNLLRDNSTIPSFESSPTFESSPSQNSPASSIFCTPQRQHFQFAQTHVNLIKQISKYAIGLIITSFSKETLLFSTLSGKRSHPQLNQTTMNFVKGKTISELNITERNWDDSLKDLQKRLLDYRRLLKKNTVQQPFNLIYFLRRSDQTSIQNFLCFYYQ